MGIYKYKKWLYLREKIDDLCDQFDAAIDEHNKDPVGFYQNEMRNVSRKLALYLPKNLACEDLYKKLIEMD